MELDAIHAIAVICKDVIDRFDAMPLEERLEIMALQQRGRSILWARR